MKRILAIALSFLLSAALFAGCGQIIGEKGGDTTTSNTESLGTPNATSAEAAQSGQLSKNIIEAFASGNYHYKMTQKNEGGETVIEVWKKDGKEATDVVMGAFKSSTIKKDGKVYVIDEDKKSYTVTTDHTPPGSGIIDAANTFKNTGKAEFNGTELAYDEYEGEGGTVMIFVENDALKGIRTVINGVTEDKVYDAYDTDVPDSVFELPADYTEAKP
ncbi:MAG: hypothetical protein LBG83_04655 [Oscillospiraceae bacterium]|jgi:hypothetical protein|nr:hypothetical protein [Oscillospiraceae bacterium]